MSGEPLSKEATLVNPALTAASSTYVAMAPLPSGGDDTAPLNAFLLAHAGQAVRLAPASYLIAGTVSIPSGTALDMLGASLTRTGGNLPVLAGAAYLTGGAGVLDLGTKITRGSIYGLATGTAETAIILRGKQCLVRDVFIQTMGGDGVQLTHKNAAGVDSGVPQFENRVLDCSALDITGIPFNLGEIDNARLTDGQARGNIGYAKTGVSNGPCLRIGQAAGWILDGFHGYGVSPQDCVIVNGGLHTTIDNLYLEHATRYGLYLAKTAYGVEVGKVTCRTDQMTDANKAAIYAENDPAYVSANAFVAIRALSVENNANVSPVAVRISSDNMNVLLAPVAIGGAFRSQVTDVAGATYGQPSIVRTRTALSTTAEGSPQWTGVNSGATVRRLTLSRSLRWSGAAAQSLTWRIDQMDNFGKSNLLVTIKSRQNENGTVQCTYVGLVSLSAKTNGTDAWVVDLTTIVAPVGFSVAPAVSVSQGSPTSQGTVTVTWTPTATDGVGVFSVAEIGTFLT